MRLAIAVPLLLLLLWAQAYWFQRLWRFTACIPLRILRRALRALMTIGVGFVIATLLATFFWGRRDLVWGLPGTVGVIGLWVTTAFLSWVGVSLVWVASLIVRRAGLWFDGAGDAPGTLPRSNASQDDVRLDRRRFFQAASALAGAIPFGAGAYGFLIGRHDYHVHQVDLPLSGLPKELEGLRIAQLSDIHIGSYMSAADVRRAVGMANELQPDLSVVTGDFLTGRNDPLEICISELARLKAPLGVWGCNGNHEIYADAQERAAELFADHGMKLLRQERFEINWRGGKLNLIGVDY